MSTINRKSNGYKTTHLLSENRPGKPTNYIENLHLVSWLESLVATLGYDLRMSAPSHSIGHVAHPEWGYRLVNQYKAQGQVLVLLDTCLGVLHQAEKFENINSNIENNIRGARKANLYKKYLADAVGKERFNEIKDTLKVTYPELFNPPV